LSISRSDKGLPWARYRSTKESGCSRQNQGSPGNHGVLKSLMHFLIGRLYSRNVAAGRLMELVLEVLWAARG
jgi:hypothetical protein